MEITQQPPQTQKVPIQQLAELISITTVTVNQR